MKTIIILLVLMINGTYAGDQFYPGNIAHRYYHAFGESDLTFNGKPILKVSYPSNDAKRAKNNYGLMQIPKVPLLTRFAVGLEDTTNHSLKTAFHDNKQSRRWNQQVYKNMRTIIKNTHSDFRHKTHFIAHRSMTFDVNLRENSGAKNDPSESLNNEPLSDPFKKKNSDFFYALSFSSSYNINNKWSANFVTQCSCSGINKKISDHRGSINNIITLKSINYIVGLTYRF